MFLLEFIVSSVSTTVVQTFSCARFDDGMFLRTELVLKCDGSDERKFYLGFAWFALFAYPIGNSIYACVTIIIPAIADCIVTSPHLPQVSLFSSS